MVCRDEHLTVRAIHQMVGVSFRRAVVWSVAAAVVAFGFRVINVGDLTTYGADWWACGFESRAARRTASIMLDGSATPLPAMSNAVP